MKRNNINYLMVGLLVITMFTLLGGVLLNITGRSSNVDIYYVLLNEISGVDEGTAVTYGGYQLGQIESIKPVRKQGKTFYRLELSVLHGWKIPTDSFATIMSPGMLSDNQVDIREGSSQVFLEPGAILKGKETTSAMAMLNTIASEITDLSENSVKPLIGAIHTQVDRTGDQINSKLDFVSARLLSLLKDFQNNSDQLSTLLGGKNQEHMTNLFENADLTSRKLLGLAKSFEATSQELTTLLQQSGSIMNDNNQDIRHAVVDLRSTMATVSQSINSIVDNLDSTSRNMSEFSRRIRENPSVIINSKPPVDNAEAGE